MILFLIALLTLNALARDPEGFSQLLTQRLNAFVEAQLQQRGIVNHEILESTRQCHDAFKSQVPDVLKEYDHIPLTNQSILINVAKAAQISLQDKLVQIYRKEFSSAVEKRSKPETVLSNLHNYNLDDLDKIRQYNIDPAVYKVRQLIDKLLIKQREQLQLLVEKYGIVWVDPQNVRYISELEGIWNFLRTVDKDPVLELIKIDYELKMADNILAWLLGAANWIDEYADLDQSNQSLIDNHLQTFIRTLGAEVDQLRVDTSRSMDEILRRFLSPDGGEHDDFIRELLDHYQETKDDQDRGIRKASELFQDLNKELKKSKVEGVLTRSSTIFFIFFGFVMLLLYFSAKDK